MMHKHNLGLETDCTWGTPVLEEVTKKPVEWRNFKSSGSAQVVSKPKKPSYHKGSCVIKDPVSNPKKPLLS